MPHLDLFESICISWNPGVLSEATRWWSCWSAWVYNFIQFPSNLVCFTSDYLMVEILFKKVNSITGVWKSEVTLLSEVKSNAGIPFNSEIHNCNLQPSETSYISALSKGSEWATIIRIVFWSIYLSFSFIIFPISNSDARHI